MTYKTLIITATFLLSNLSLSAQNEIDSLKAIINSEQHDTLRMDALLRISKEYRSAGKFDQALDYCNQALELLQVLTSSSNNVIAKAGRIGIIRAYHRLGATVKKTNEHSKAVPYFFKALQLAENESLNEEMGSIMSSIGWYYYGQGDYPKALEYGFKQLKLGEEIEDEWRIASAYNDIGVVYKRQMQHTKAIAYLCKSVRLCEENGETW